MTFKFSSNTINITKEEISNDTIQKRQLAKIVEDICNRNKYNFESFSQDWFMKVTIPGIAKPCLIYGYRFPNNTSSASYICDDKSALSDVLTSLNIPNVEHKFFERADSENIDNNGTWKNIQNYFTQHKKIVCQTNNGSGGKNVFKCENPKEMEIAVNSIFSTHRGISISPYVDIKNEYRVIVEGNEAMVIYNKRRPYVVGDGKQTVGQLIQLSKFNKDIEISEKLDLDKVLKNGEEETIAWKHNLGQGSLPELIKDKELIKKLATFAISSANKLDLHFASVDIVRDVEDNFMILEINSGVMMENFSSINKSFYEMSLHIYEKAINDYLGVKTNSKNDTVYQKISREVNVFKENTTIIKNDSIKTDDTESKLDEPLTINRI